MYFFAFQYHSQYHVSVNKEKSSALARIRTHNLIICSLDVPRTYRHFRYLPTYVALLWSKDWAILIETESSLKKSLVEATKNILQDQ